MAKSLTNKLISILLSNPNRRCGTFFDDGTYTQHIFSDSEDVNYSIAVSAGQHLLETFNDS